VYKPSHLLVKWCGHARIQFILKFRGPTADRYCLIIVKLVATTRVSRLLKQDLLPVQRTWVHPLFFVLFLFFFVFCFYLFVWYRRGLIVYKQRHRPSDSNNKLKTKTKYHTVRLIQKSNGGIVVIVIVWLLDLQLPV
jgi:hypothetical protein